MVLKRIKHLNAKRYKAVFLVFKKKKLINCVNKKNIFLGNNFFLNTVLNTKFNVVNITYTNFINNFNVKTNLQFFNIFKGNYFNFLLYKKSYFFFLFNKQNTIKLNQLICLIKFKTIYIASYGTYLLYMSTNQKYKKLIFKLPSGKFLFSSYFVLSVLGQNVFTNRKHFKPKQKSNTLRHKKIIVRGVAMNPIDHHNGGRSNKKPLFLNKYNKIAKYNK